LGEREIPEQPKALPKYRPGHPLTLIADQCPFLKRVLDEQNSVLLPDTSGEKDWHTFTGHSQLRSCQLRIAQASHGAKHLGTINLEID